MSNATAQLLTVSLAYGFSGGHSPWLLPLDCQASDWRRCLEAKEKLVSY
jgi:hypothetical protein